MSTNDKRRYKRLTEEDKRRIPGIYSQTQSYQAVADEIGCCTKTISRYVKGNLKKHIELVPKDVEYTIQVVLQ